MRLPIIPLLLAALAPCLSAQEAHLGLGFNLLLPTGGFRSTTYGPTTSVTTAQTEGYDIGLGGQFTASFPVERNLAIRLNVSGHGTHGTNTAQGYKTLNLEHSIFSLGGELQVFLDGSAYRHKGTYLFGGVSADFERFDRSYGNVDWDSTDTTRKSRMGGTFGMGRTFGWDSGTRFTLEVSFHKTLNGSDPARQEPPATDFAKFTIGWVF